MIKAGAVHIEDQVQEKRCGHRPNKAIVSQEEMVDRIKTEFGSTPLFTTEELASVGVRIVLYPLSAFRAMMLRP